MFQRLIVLFFFSFSFTLCSSQFKYEREYRLDENKVPLKALSFIDSLELGRKIKWYKEESIEEQTIEAKTKHKGKKISIEFDRNGNLQDIEVTISCSSIPDTVLNTICKHLQKKYTKYRFKKIQEQYTGDKRLMKTITSDSISKNLTIRYEIILLVKNKNEHKKIEFLFSSSGSFILKREIVEENMDHLEY